jgi:hypothetical protein
MYSRDSEYAPPLVEAKNACDTHDQSGGAAKSQPQHVTLYGSPSIFHCGRLVQRW